MSTNENPLTKESIQAKIEERGKTLQELQGQGKQLAETIQKGQNDLARVRATAQEIVGAIKQLQELKAIAPIPEEEPTTEFPRPVEPDATDDKAPEN